MFGVAIHIALKIAIKSIYVLQKTFTNFNKPQFQTGATKIRKKKTKKLQYFGIKNFWKWPVNLELRPFL